MPPATVLPFGKHKDQPLGGVPADYLRWLLRECKLSSGLRAAVVEELTARGIATPPPAPPRPIQPCDRCGPAGGVLIGWMQIRTGGRRLRAECRRCRALLDHPPCVPPYTTEADKTLSTTAVLDALTRLETLGVELQSDGRGVWIGWPERQRVPAELVAVVRQCSHQLATMIGDTRTMANAAAAAAATPRPTTTRGTP